MRQERSGDRHEHDHEDDHEDDHEHDQPVPAAGVEDRARRRLRVLRTERGWTLDELARRSGVNASTISRIETGRRRLALDHLAALAGALGTSVDDILRAPDEDVVIRPLRASFAGAGATTWLLTGRADDDRVVAKVRYAASRTRPEPQVHPGREWLYVLDGTLRLVLGDRELLVAAGQAAQFSTAEPHWHGAYGGPVEVLVIFDRHGEQAHLRGRG
jgi:transcriptional regulator with XRE-family HTH domain